jgi:Zn-dependent peptidase ImmA (M78 family)
VKNVPDRTGRFAIRPHYEPAELDSECESIITSFLRKKYGEVRFPISTDDLTTFMEKDVADLDLYADLSEFGQNVEGVTIFSSQGKPSVRITSALANDPHRENRLRTTLTHEWGHVHFHAYLWNVGVMELDFGDIGASSKRPKDNRQICKRESLIDAPVSDWMEWQAGHVCGAILMPANHLKHMLKERFESEIGTATVTPGSLLGERLIQAVVDTYAVSREAARVRLLRIGLIQEHSRNVSLFPA